MTTRVCKMSRREFDELPEYSCTLPTGTTIGKKWKRREPYGADPDTATWYLGTYVDIGTNASPIARETKIGIEWWEIEIETPRETQIREALDEEREPACLNAT